MGRRSTVAIDRSSVVDAAFALLEEAGLDGLSTRRLAQGLSIQAPALYWHIRDKADLIRLMADRIYAQAYVAAVGIEEWRLWLLAFGRALHAEIRRHRDAARLCAISRAADFTDAVERAREVAEPLVRLGLTLGNAIAFLANVISFAIGWGIFEENGPIRQFLGEIIDIQDSFERGLQSLVDGLRER